MNETFVRLKGEIVRAPDIRTDHRGKKYVTLAVRVVSKSKVAWARILALGSLADVASDLTTSDTLYFEGEAAIETSRDGRRFYDVAAITLCPLASEQDFPAAALWAHDTERRVMQ